MTTPYRRLLLGLALLGAAACSERAADPAAPAALTPPAPAATSLYGVTNTSFDASPTQDVTVNLGNNLSITIPAGAVCDMSVTQYGAAYWNQPCTDAGAPVTIKAQTWIAPNGQTQVSFWPALRFDPSKTAYLQYKKQVPLGNLLYCPVDNDIAQCYDESLTDPSLQTQYINGAYLQRRVKHFSGYLVAVG